MLSFSGSLRVFVAVEACDMRKGFEGLSALVGSVLNEEVKSGALFAFSNRRRTRLKILYWDGSGLWVLSKTHASHCADRKFLTDSLPLSSTLWARGRSVRRGWRVEGHRVYRAAEQNDTRDSWMDV